MKRTCVTLFMIGTILLTSYIIFHNEVFLGLSGFVIGLGCGIMERR